MSYWCCVSIPIQEAELPFLTLIAESECSCLWVFSTYARLLFNTLQGMRWICEIVCARLFVFVFPKESWLKESKFRNVLNSAILPLRHFFCEHLISRFSKFLYLKNINKIISNDLLIFKYFIKSIHINYSSLFLFIISFWGNRASRVN